MSRFSYIILGDQWCVALSQFTIMCVNCFVNCKLLYVSIIIWGCWWVIDTFSKKNQYHGFPSLNSPRQIFFYSPAGSAHYLKILPGASLVWCSIYSMDKHIQLMYCVLGPLVRAWQMLPQTIPCSLLFTLFVINVIDIIWNLLVRTQRHREMQEPAQCHTSTAWQGQAMKPESSSKPVICRKLFLHRVSWKNSLCDWTKPSCFGSKGASKALWAQAPPSPFPFPPSPVWKALVQEITPLGVRPLISCLQSTLA